MRRWIPVLAILVTLATAAPATAAPFKVRLKTPHSQPRANKPWRITVIVRSNGGHALHATAFYQFVFNGQVVSNQYPDPKTHKVGRRHKPWPFYGSYSDELLFPAKSVGYPLTFRVQVTVKRKGRVHRDRRIRVRK